MTRLLAGFGLVLALCGGFVSNASAACDGLETAVVVSADCGGVTYEGCCLDGKTRWCAGSGEGLCESPCTPDALCGWLADPGFYDCGATDTPPAEFPKDCGGGTCSADCVGKECGSDGCSGTCGTCAMNETCNAGICEGAVCTPSCTDKACGDDGCGGLCGTCPANETCSNGECLAVCQPVCEGAECGLDGCGGSCGTCQAGETCVERLCVSDSCVPNCTNKECGDDGCGTPCGFCGMGLTCVNSMCEEGSTMDINIDWDTVQEDGSFITVDITVTDNGKGSSSGGCTAGSTPSTSVLSMLLLLGLAAALRFGRNRK